MIRLEADLNFMKPRVIAALLLVIAASGAVGCRTAKEGQAKQEEAETSTGLAYRPPGKPTMVDVPSAYRIYPTPKPLVR